MAWTAIFTAIAIAGSGAAIAAERKPRSLTAPKTFAGVASFYNQPGKVASGGRYDPRKLTAAHRSLPFGTRLRVTDPKSGRSVVVVINDRGPFIRGRVIDLSLAAARELRMMKRGLMRVQVAVQ
ncbi:MAG: septal ring lytic transglycosylase RlpA family protein [Pseudolabrys sp.]